MLGKLYAGLCGGFYGGRQRFCMSFGRVTVTDLVTRNGVNPSLFENANACWEDSSASNIGH